MHVTTGLPQLSVALTLKNTGAPLELVQAAVMFAGHVMTGGWLSMTITLNPHVRPLPLVSVAPHTTKLVPF